MQAKITFRCEGCGTRIVIDGEPEVYSALAMGCSLDCTLKAVTARYNECKAVLKTRSLPPQWQVQMVQAEMRPQQWLKLAEQELRLERARLQEEAHRERLARDYPDLLQRFEAEALRR